MKKNSITKNVTYNLIYQILTVLLPLITTPYLSRKLGSAPIGIYGFTLSIVTYFVLFGSLGTAMYGQREIAKNESSPKKISIIFWEITIIRILAMIISMVAFYIFFCRNGNYIVYYKLFLIYMVAYTLNISWFFQGIEQFDRIVIRNIIVKIVGLLLIFTLIKSPKDLWIYVLIFSGSELLGNISLWFYLPKYLVKTNIKNVNLKKHIIPVLMLFIPQVATQIYTVLDKTMVGLITGNMNKVGFYEQAQNIAKATLVIIASVQTVMNSRVAKANADGDKKEIKECLRKSFDFVWMLGIPMMLGVICVAGNLVPWYFGKGFEPVKNILIATSPIIIVIGLSGITGIVYLIHTGQQKPFTTSVIIGAFINVILNFILINIFGTIGAAISSVIAEVSILLFHFKYIKKAYKISDIFKVSTKPIISGIIMFAVVFPISLLLKPSIINTGILTIIGAVVYTLCLYILKYELLLNTLEIGLKILKLNKKKS